MIPGAANIASRIIERIHAEAPPVVLPVFIRALQIRPGGYGEGDELCGVKVPTLRKIAKDNRDIPLEAVEVLLASKLHDARFVALVILCMKFRQAPKDVLDVYLRNVRHINNWDLVDCSAPHIVGAFCLTSGEHDVITRLADADNFWKNRIAIVATLAFIKTEQFVLTLGLCERFIHHEHHLIHKACGWMLREVSKRAPELVIDFLQEHQDLSSITRSYATEWMRKRGGGQGSTS